MTTQPSRNGSGFTLGVIEGFFGSPWSWETREAYAGFMCDTGMTTYCYAPKADTWLRRHWAEPLPDEHLDRLIHLSNVYQQKNLSFGIGLSPFELYRDFNPANREKLQNKIVQLNSVAPDLLCILFDDMPGNCPDLAKRQVQIMDCVIQHSTATRFALCPTYYSDDPQLTSHFGPMPPDYHEQLGSLLEPDTDIFWTGPSVVSDSYPLDHLKDVAERFGRNPLIWDNYPVNDSQRMVNHLHLRPARRSTQLDSGSCAGILANPMNQAWLSTIPLAGLAAQYGSQMDKLSSICRNRCGDELGDMLLSDLETFQERGLKEISDDERSDLIKRYTPYKEQPCALEVIDWLNGNYAFDPACLTQ